MLKISKKMVLTMLVASVTLISCKKKNEVPLEQIESKALIPNYDKLAKYVSVSFNTEVENVRFDIEKQEFYLIGKPSRVSLEEVLRYYDKANVYKAIYEKD